MLFVSTYLFFPCSSAHLCAHSLFRCSTCSEHTFFPPWCNVNKLGVKIGSVRKTKYFLAVFCVAYEQEGGQRRLVNTCDSINFFAKINTT